MIRLKLERPSPMAGDYEARDGLVCIAARYVQRYRDNPERLQALLDVMSDDFVGELYDTTKRDNRARAEAHPPPSG